VSDQTTKMGNYVAAKNLAKTQKAAAKKLKNVHNAGKLLPGVPDNKEMVKYDGNLLPQLQIPNEVQDNLVYYEMSEDLAIGMKLSNRVFAFEIDDALPGYMIRQRIRKMLDSRLLSLNYKQYVGITCLELRVKGEKWTDQYYKPTNKQKIENVETFRKEKEVGNFDVYTDFQAVPGTTSRVTGFQILEIYGIALFVICIFLVIIRPGSIKRVLQRVFRSCTVPCRRPGSWYGSTSPSLPSVFAKTGPPKWKKVKRDVNRNGHQVSQSAKNRNI